MINQFPLYFYIGWSNTWDRYVTAEFLLKDTAVNRELQQRVKTSPKVLYLLEYDKWILD